MFFLKKKPDFDYDLVLEQLREKYKKLAEEYSPNMFNILKFEDRYTEALKHRIDIESFLKAEVEALDKIVKDLRQPKKEKMSDKPDSFTKKVEKMLEEFDERIKIYPYEDFHPKADEDIKYLYGGLKLFYKNIYYNLETIYSIKNVGTSIAKDFTKFSRYIEYTARESSGNVSKRISDYMIKLRNYNDKDIEKDYRNFLIDTGSYFNDLKSFLQNTISVLNDKADKVFIQNGIFEETKYSHADFVITSIKWIEDFLYNFRISEFV